MKDPSNNNRFEILFLIFIIFSNSIWCQGVTSSQIGGQILDNSGQTVIGAVIKLEHLPSGTIYGTVSNAEGRYLLQGLRVGGPYKLNANLMGMSESVKDNIYTALGVTTIVDFTMKEEEFQLKEIVVSESRTGIFSSSRTGATSNFSSTIINALPSIGARSINSITKYDPHGNGSSFGAQDSRLNNFTIDGSVFNNGFGLGSESQAGGRTGSTAISLDAIEQIQLNVAPYDVRQSGFVGSGINAITKSGNNQFSGTAFYAFRDPTTTGKRAAENFISVPNFDEKIYGISLAGPIIKNKLFFFLNGEFQIRTEPATTFVAEGSALQGTKTRVLKSDLDSLRSFLKNKFNYETGEYEAYNADTKSEKFLLRLDYNLNTNNKVSLRYTHHNSSSDQLISNSTSAGAGNRRSRIDAMSFQNSGYTVGDNTRSIVAELNSNFNKKFYNNIIAGSDYQNEDRLYSQTIFPTIDILKDNRTYISTGFDPFTPNNKLNYRTIHFTNNLSFGSGRNNYVLGVHFENYQSNNLFFPASNGVYVFNSLSDFYEAANSSADTSPVSINKFQYRYSALDNFQLPLQVLKINRFDLYAQDDIQLTEHFKFTAGVRASVINFGNTAMTNDTIINQFFVDQNGNRDYTLNTGVLPRPNILWEPRLGFNWNVDGKNITQIRGGSGIFTGRPPYVWISNQIGNNGILTGFLEVTNSKKYKFTTDPTVFRPNTPMLPSTFDLASTHEDYRFPQVWKSGISVDQKIGNRIIGTIEFMFNKNINSVLYYDANLEPIISDTARFRGPDNRFRFPGSYVPSSQINNATRVNDNVSRAVIMTTTNKGFYQALVFKLEYPSQKGISGMIAYTYSSAKDIMSASSIASGSYTSLRTINGNNKPELTFSDNDIPHRVIGFIAFRKEYGTKCGAATQISLGYSGMQVGSSPNGLTARYSLAYSGDMNGDNIADNDVLFIPEKASDIKFQQYDFTQSDRTVTTFTAAMQQAAFERYIDNNKQLIKLRGEYVERNALIFPFIHNFDFSILQEYFFKTKKRKHSIQFRMDFLNVGNLLNRNWGVGKTLVTDRPLAYRSTVNGIPEFRLATQTINGKADLIRDTYVNKATLADVFSGQFSVRYIF